MNGGGGECKMRCLDSENVTEIMTGRQQKKREAYMRISAYYTTVAS